MKQVKITEFIDGLIEELVEKRKEEGSLVITKQSIVHQAVDAYYKKEIKK